MTALPIGGEIRIVNTAPPSTAACVSLASVCSASTTVRCVKLEMLAGWWMAGQPDVCKVDAVPASYSQSGRGRGSLDGSLAPLDGEAEPISLRIYPFIQSYPSNELRFP